jgi:hypothetical protein
MHTRELRTTPKTMKQRLRDNKPANDKKIESQKSENTKQGRKKEQ